MEAAERPESVPFRIDSQTSTVGSAPEALAGLSRGYLPVTLVTSSGVGSRSAPCHRCRPARETCDRAARYPRGEPDRAGRRGDTPGPMKITSYDWRSAGATNVGCMPVGIGAVGPACPSRRHSYRLLYRKLS